VIFSKLWRPYFWVVSGLVIATGILVQLDKTNLLLAPLALIIFGLFLPFYFIFEYSLTDKGETEILFENLLFYLEHFERRNVFWKQIAGKVKRLLKTGNIDVSKGDLIYYFNLKLWETNDDLIKQLRDIEEWLLDRQASCYQSIKQIIPAVCFSPTKRSFWSEPTATRVDVDEVLNAIKVLGTVIGIIIAVVIAIYFHVSITIG
jgi:hypothetical protein